MMKKIFGLVGMMMMAIAAFADYSIKVEVPAIDYNVLTFEGKQYQVFDQTINNIHRNYTGFGPASWSTKKEVAIVEEGITVVHFDGFTEVLTYHGDTAAMEAWIEECKDVKKIKKMSAAEIAEKGTAASKGVTGMTTIVIDEAGNVYGKEFLEARNIEMMKYGQLPVADQKVLKKYLKANR